MGASRPRVEACGRAMATRTLQLLRQIRAEILQVGVQHVPSMVPGVCRPKEVRSVMKHTDERMLPTSLSRSIDWTLLLCTCSNLCCRRTRGRIVCTPRGESACEEVNKLKRAMFYIKCNVKQDRSTCSSGSSQTRSDRGRVVSLP